MASHIPGAPTRFRQGELFEPRPFQAIRVHVDEQEEYRAVPISVDGLAKQRQKGLKGALEDEKRRWGKN